MKKLLKNLLSNLPVLAIGLFTGSVLSNLVPEPGLHYLVCRDAFYGLLAFVFILIAIVPMVVLFLAAKPPRLSKKTWRTLFLGVSISAFASAFLNFINYANILASDYSWLTGDVNIYLARQYVLTGHAFIDANLGALIFFIALISWDSFIGSFFAVLEHLPT